MNFAEAKPVKKRRRWLVAALVLALASLVTWWLLQRADARFVGKWRMVPEGALQHLAVWVFHDNGSGEYLLRNGKLEGEFDWRADGTTYQMGMLRGGRWPPWQILLYRLGRTLSRTPDGVVYEITSVSADSISIRAKESGQGWGEFTLERVSE